MAIFFHGVQLHWADPIFHILNGQKYEHWVSLILITFVVYLTCILFEKTVSLCPSSKWTNMKDFSILAMHHPWILLSKMVITVAMKSLLASNLQLQLSLAIALTPKRSVFYFIVKNGRNIVAFFQWSLMWTRDCPTFKFISKFLNYATEYFDTIQIFKYCF